jgi:hypothetical protein
MPVDKSGPTKELVQYFFVSSNFCCLSGKHVMQHRLLGVFNSLEIYLQNYDKSSSHRCTIRVGVGPDLSTGIVGATFFLSIDEQF